VPLFTPLSLLPLSNALIQQMGIQHKMSRFRILEGPLKMQEVPLHSEVPFSWEFEGFGNTYCFVDGKLMNNYGQFECRPPLNVQLHDRRNHTLTVMMRVRLDGW
jgi:hypothetical protein